ncbi:hypothetical protein ABRZ04_04245 [Castellaniella ginsengisoli]|uniref:Uncharacterized protein n=1 Tax=Castellaniella ginsengisoli TaxID=546114 RepID=A0AB39D2R2_9BURK
MNTEIKLPPLPEPDGSMTIIVAGREVEIDTFRASTMDAYARAAVEAALASRTVPSGDEIIEAVKAYGAACSIANTTATELSSRLQEIRALLSSYGQPDDQMFRDLETRVQSLDAECARLEAENDRLKNAQPAGYIHPDNVRRLEAGETVAFRKKPYNHDGGGIPVFIGAGCAPSDADRETLMLAIVQAGQRAGIIRADLESASVIECLHILECLSKPAAGVEPIRYLIRGKAKDDEYTDDPRYAERLAEGRRESFDGEDETEIVPLFAIPAAASAEPVAWESKTLAYQKHITDARYQSLRPAAKRWYKPYRCTSCAAPVSAQAQATMPPLTKVMRAVLRNENDVYGDEDALYAALCDAAQAQPVVNQSLTTEREALAAALKALEAISDEMTVGERYTNAGQYLIDALPTVRAALAQQSAEQPSGNSGELSGQDREDAADMFWNADDPERFGGDNLHDTLVDLADDYGDPDFPLTVRLQCAKRLPDVQAVVTGRNDDGELVYEVIDAARAAKEQS